MLHLSSGPALMVEFGLAIFCFVDALITPEAAVRWVPRWGWVLFVLVFPLCGSILWLTAGHPWRRQVREAASAIAAIPTATGGAPSTASPGAVDRNAAGVDGGYAPRVSLSPDAVLAEELLAVHDEHEQTLRAWEADLRRREAALRAETRHPAA
jgi:hypothetical protein